MGKAKQNKMTNSPKSGTKRKDFEDFKARARSRLHQWKQKQALLKASSSSTGVASGPAKLSRKEFKLMKRANRRPLTRSNVHQRVPDQQQRPEQFECNDSSDSDSDIEIIELKPEVVVLDDESEDDDIGSSGEAANGTEADKQQHIETKVSAETAEKICTPNVTNERVNVFAEDTNSTEPPPPGTEDYVYFDESMRTVDNQQLPNSQDAIVASCSLNTTIESVESADLEKCIGHEIDPDKSKQLADDTSRPVCTTPVIGIDNMLHTLSPITPATKDASLSRISVTETPPSSAAPATNSWAGLFREQPSSSPKPVMFFDDKQGSIDNPVVAPVPLYEAISDDSFISDRSLRSASPVVSVKKPTANGVPAASSTSVETINLLASPGIPTPRNVRKRKHNKQTPSKSADNAAADADDSVVFVSETTSSATAAQKRAGANFISIANQRSANVTFNSRLPKNARHQPSTRPPPNALVKRVFQRALANQRQQPSAPVVTNNSYNPAQSKVDLTKSAKRMVIIDGSNVAFGHSTNHTFSVRGLAICIEFFEREGHLVKAVLPQMRLKQTMSSDPVLLEKLHEQGKVVLTPCKNLPGRSATSYDDRFILDLAIEFDAAVISNDNYRDLFMEDELKYRPIIETRVVGYTWCMDMIMFPKDPYGRGGPTLEDILNRKG